jgi:hypothetical protein
VKDLHLGVVSSDMGLLGIDGVDNCSGFGDDGILQHRPSADSAVTGCQPSYPTFLTYVSGTNDPRQTATDFACIATLGTGGCGFEQQLEAPLKALWPSVDPMPNADGSNRITFLGDAMGNGTFGHGDTDNAGFLRNDPTQGLSVIAIVIMTDEEDCSSSNTHHFVPPTFLDPNDPLAAQPLNLRCFFNEQKNHGDELYPVERYINGFKALRPGNENLVMFAAIAGVPTDLVDPQHLARVDFHDQRQRDGFYQSILSDARMQEVIDPASTTVPGSGNLLPSCNTVTGKAFPPRRIVQVAQGFGENGIVQSICQQNFGPALDAVTAMISRQLGAVCLPRRLMRDGDGLVGCDVFWELPKPGSAPASTPEQCGQKGFEFLLDPGGERPSVSDTGGAICKVVQLAVAPDRLGGLNTTPTTVDGTRFSEGWYYDDFSDDTQKSCTAPTKQRIAFSAKAQPSPFVTVKLECVNEARPASSRTDIATNVEQPSLGDACDQAERTGQTLMGDAACAVRLVKPTKKWPDGVDKSMFCHPATNICVLSCASDDDCPAAWTCDKSADTLAASGNRAFCVAPGCSAGAQSASTKQVGDSCLPDVVPEVGFDEREAFVGTSDDECGGGVCLTYHLRGDPRPGCIPNEALVCATPSDVLAHVYCSCRCHAPAGYAECTCPSGFSCTDVLAQGSADVRGGYCVKDGA